MPEPTPDLRYPIGRFVLPEPLTTAIRDAGLDALAAAPSKLRAAVAGLDDRQLDTRYRPGGWTVRQVTHHVADSHANAWIRCRLALTEDHPTIKPYEEGAWAELPDYRLPVAGSLALLDRIHERWVALLRALPETSFARTYYHPGSGRTVSIDAMIAEYAWHGAHHVAQVVELRRREGW